MFSPLTAAFFVKPKMAVVGSPREFERFGDGEKNDPINVVVTVDQPGVLIAG